MCPALYELPVASLEGLSATEAVDFLRRLLWAEARRVGIGRDLVLVHHNINEPDGGIDAVVRDAEPESDELIPTGTSGFQCKAGDLEPSECKKELRSGNGACAPIREEIGRLLEAGGTYVLVLFRSLTYPKRVRREAALRSELERLGYPSAKFVLLDATMLAGFVERFPALIARLMPNRSECLPYQSWAKVSHVCEPRGFIEDAPRAAIVQSMQQAIRNRDGRCPVIRVVGLPGVGKTRTVFAALGVEDLRQQVLYVDAQSFRHSRLLYELMTNESLAAIVVADECDRDIHSDLVRRLEARGSRLALITVSEDLTGVGPPVHMHRIEGLSDSDMERLLAAEFPELPGMVRDRIATFADGFPRIAIVLAKEYFAGEAAENEFISLGESRLLERLIGGSADPTSEYFSRTERVLSGISLFSRLGYEGQAAAESEWWAHHSGIPLPDFRKVVLEQRQRGIVRGKNYIFVTPLMLRLHLLRRWWDTEGFASEQFQTMIGSMPETCKMSLWNRFAEHLPYVSQSPSGRRFVAELLGDTGPFVQAGLLDTEMGGGLLWRLTEADPDAALSLLRRTVGHWTHEQLLGFTHGRRGAVEALERIAVWRSLFADAARMLLALGEAETETFSNNASGIFRGLFTLSTGELAPTEASPAERQVVLEEAMASQSHECRMLAIGACGSALSTHGGMKVIGPEYQGARRLPQMWRPQTWGEFHDAYRGIWNLLFSSLDGLSEPEKSEAVRVLLEKARGLTNRPNLADMVVDTLDTMRNKPYVREKDVLKTVIEVLHHDGGHLPETTRQRLEALRDELAGTDYPGLMRRYVGMNLLEDRFDEQGNHVDQVQPRLIQLAEESVACPALLQSELHWLVTQEAPNGFAFGYLLGCEDSTQVLLCDILQAQAGAPGTGTLDFLGGYLRAVTEKDIDRWESVLDGLSDDPASVGLVPELVQKSGLPSNRAAERILALAEKGDMDVEGFRLFVFGGAIKSLSEDIFQHWIDFLLAQNSTAATAIVLGLFFYRFDPETASMPLPHDMARRVVLHDAWFKSEPNTYRHVDEFLWSVVVKRFVHDYPDDGVEVARKLLEHLADMETIAGQLDSYSRSVLLEVAKLRPSEVWALAAGFIDSPLDRRAVAILEWLQGEGLFGDGTPAALSFVPPEEVWTWVDVAPDTRARMLARFVPKDLSHPDAGYCWAREVLARYGDRPDVRRALSTNMSAEGWWGNASEHYGQKIEALLSYREGEKNPHVLSWIDEYVRGLEAQRQREVETEEREGF